VWIKSKRFLLLLVLSLLYLFVPSISYSYAEVILTDAEATEMLSEIQQSKKELETLKSQLETAETQLTDVKNTYEEQKTSYEKQLEEAEKDKEKLKIATSISGGSALTLLIVTVLLIIF
jgi:peptidoglycan hydrolase CwlO-like protein